MAGGAAPYAQAKRPALFVGLEGTLVDEPNFGSATGPIPHADGAREALAALALAGFCIVVVANQSGLALGRFSRWEFSRREARLQQEMRMAGVELGPFVICPHAPGPDGRPACLCRLPAPGLLVRAARSQGLDMASSWIVGSSREEAEAGRRAGCHSVLLRSAAGAELGGANEPRPWPTQAREPDRCCTGWAEVAREILADRVQVQALP
jgi:histidinol-phosphate phosphatase family protein